MIAVHLYIQVKFYVPKIKRLLYGHRTISGGVADGNVVEVLIMINGIRLSMIIIGIRLLK